MAYHDPDHLVDISIPINANHIPCVVRDTMIITDQDEVPVQDLSVGDRVFSPDSDFDMVERIIHLSVFGHAAGVAMCYPAQSVGNHTELSVSPGCRVLGRYRGVISRLGLASKDLYPDRQNLACRRVGSFAFYCIVLRHQQTLMANGAIISAINLADLANLRTHRAAQLSSA